MVITIVPCPITLAGAKSRDVATYDVTGTLSTHRYKNILIHLQRKTELATSDHVINKMTNHTANTPITSQNDTYQGPHSGRLFAGWLFCSGFVSRSTFGAPPKNPKVRLRLVDFRRLFCQK